MPPWALHKRNIKTKKEIHETFMIYSHDHDHEKIRKKDESGYVSARRGACHACAPDE
jgi:hypothetical protein